MKSAPDPRRGVVYVASRLVVDAVTTFAPGALAVADGSVLLAGSKADVLRASPAGYSRMEFPGAAIVPGLVNAHVHLQIPRFADPAGKTLPIPPSFVDWILRVIAWRRGADPASFAANFKEAAGEALSFGTTTVGEIAGPDLSVYDGCPLRARVFAEGIGIEPPVAPVVLAMVSAAIDRLETSAASNPLIACGVSPHTLYTVGETLLRSLAGLAAAKDLPACLHLAESSAETAFLADGGGEIATRLYPAVGKDVSWFRGLGRTIPGHLREVGLLREGLLLVHNVHLAHPEIDALRDGGARFVLCPRSNAAHGNGVPDVTRFVDAKIPFALGTDSLGSVPDLSLWSEMRSARSMYKGRKKDTALCRELFRAATEHGAAALGLAGGILSPGEPGDIAVVDDPGSDGDRLFRDLVEKTDRENVRMTVVAGQTANAAAAE
jgi:cytosine/adenosine deaminase-related metal-dependent hydrolase